MPPSCVIGFGSLFFKRWGGLWHKHLWICIHTYSVHIEPPLKKKKMAPSGLGCRFECFALFSSGSYPKTAYPHLPPPPLRLVSYSLQMEIVSNSSRSTVVQCVYVSVSGVGGMGWLDRKQWVFFPPFPPPKRGEVLPFYFFFFLHPYSHVCCLFRPMWTIVNHILRPYYSLLCVPIGGGATTLFCEQWRSCH